MLKKKYQGKVWKFSDNVSTDAIAPGRLLHLRSKPEEYAKHVLEDANSEFSSCVKKDDFIVAGNNFGCGSSREIAPIIIKISGVGAILAKSFGRIFYRNAINNGMLLIQCNTDTIEDGATLSIDTEKNEITKKGDSHFKKTFQLGEIEKRILEEDGLLAYIQKHKTLERL
jgi:3-isopropylmalate/(R)-2-methylmalate dehydratase small subunit